MDIKYAQIRCKNRHRVPFEILFSDSPRLIKLQRGEARVEATFGNQALMRSGGDKLPLIKHKNPVGFRDGREAMRDNQSRASAH